MTWSPTHENQVQINSLTPVAAGDSVPAIACKRDKQRLQADQAVMDPKAAAGTAEVLPWPPDPV